jgi:hypothetical protein
MSKPENKDFDEFKRDINDIGFRVKMIGRKSVMTRERLDMEDGVT